MVALLFSANPDLTGEQARMIVEETADEKGGVEYDDNGHNDYYGHGRVNAARAVRAAQLGFDNPTAAACAEDLNCSSRTCLKVAPSDLYGQCWIDCSAHQDGTPCHDGSACTENDTCAGGLCTGSPTTCDDGDVCTDDTCDPETGCVYDHNQASCDDGDPCTEGERCSSGRCGGGEDLCEDSGEGCSCAAHGSGSCGFLVLAFVLGRFRRLRPNLNP